jgi:hypothetical protein
MPATRRATPVARHLVALGALTTAAMSLVAGCSSNGSTPPSTTSTTTTVPPATIATTIPFSITKNARQDVTTPSPCRQTNGLWVLSGTIKNSAQAARTYQIVVDFVSRTGNTVLDTKVITTNPVPAGSSLPWSAKSTPGLTNVACVIRQVQAPA